MKAFTHPTSLFGFQLDDRVVAKSRTTCQVEIPRMTGSVTKVYKNSMMVTWDSGVTERFNQCRKPDKVIRKLRDEEDW